MSTHDSVLLTCAQMKEPWASIRVSVPQVEMGEKPLCTMDVYARLCELIEQAGSSPQQEGDAIVIEAISKLHRESPSIGGGANVRERHIQLLQAYLALRQKQSAATVPPSVGNNAMPSN